MKNFFLISLLFIELLNCGSITSWSKEFYNAQNDAVKLDALKFIHCESIVDEFNGDTDKVIALDSLLTQALLHRETIASPDKYVINLVFKNYVRFDLEDYDNLTITSMLAKGAGMSDKELRKVIKNIPKDAAIRKANNINSEHSLYSAQIAEEINEIYQ